jgi:hypothetical protein
MFGDPTFADAILDRLVHRRYARYCGRGRPRGRPLYSVLHSTLANKFSLVTGFVATVVEGPFLTTARCCMPEGERHDGAVEQGGITGQRRLSTANGRRTANTYRADVPTGAASGYSRL